MRKFWRVGVARNAAFFHNFATSQAGKSQLLKNGIAEDRLPRMSPKFTQLFGAKAILKSKIVVELVCPNFIL